MKTKVPGSVAYKVLKLTTRQRNSSQQTVACERNRWIAEAVSPDSQSRISAKQSTVCGTAQFNRCLCATKDTAEVSRVSNGK